MTTTCSAWGLGPGRAASLRRRSADDWLFVSALPGGLEAKIAHYRCPSVRWEWDGARLRRTSAAACLDRVTGLPAARSADPCRKCVVVVPCVVSLGDQEQIRYPENELTLGTSHAYDAS